MALEDAGRALEIAQTDGAMKVVFDPALEAPPVAS